MEPSRRPKPSTLELQTAENETIEVPTYDVLTKLTTYLFIVYFFNLIRDHPPSDNIAYTNQPMPKFISTVMGCKDSIFEITDYLASFDLMKLNPLWVKFIPTKHTSQEAVNRLGLRVAGYRLVSIFNVVEPPVLTSAPESSEETHCSTFLESANIPGEFIETPRPMRQLMPFTPSQDSNNTSLPPAPKKPHDGFIVQDDPPVAPLNLNTRVIQC